MPFSKSIWSELSVAAAHYSLKSIPKMGHSHKQLLIIGPNWHFCARWSEKAWCALQIRANSCECSDHWIQLATFGCSGHPRAHKPGTNSSVSTHDIIIDGSCLGLGHFFPRFVTSCSRVKVLFCSRVSSATRSSLLASLLIVVPSDNLPSATFDNIMRYRSGGSVNEAGWWMLITTLTLPIFTAHSSEPKSWGGTQTIKP